MTFGTRRQPTSSGPTRPVSLIDEGPRPGGCPTSCATDGAAARPAGQRTPRPRARVAGRRQHVDRSAASQGQSASELVSKRIAELGDWRGETLSRMRTLIKEADPDVVEEWKWMGTPIWSHDGIICTGESYKTVVKHTFPKGASLKDPSVSSTRVSTETPGARSTSTKENKLTSPPSRRLSARRSLCHSASPSGPRSGGIPNPRV